MSEEQPSQASRETTPPQPAVTQFDYSQPPQQTRYYPPPDGPPTAIDRLIPVKNVKALLAYYFGVFSIVPCFAPFLGPAAIILGIMGLKLCKSNPNMPGKGHAITGIVIGSIMTFLVLAVVVFALIGRSLS